jgi:hypothetical protein
MFARVLLAVSADLLFLGGVVLLNWAAQHWVFERFELHGSSKFALTVLEWALTVSTLGTVLSFLARDTVVALLRPWRRAGGIDAGAVSHAVVSPDVTP